MMGGLEILKRHYQFRTTNEHALHTDSGTSRVETVALPTGTAKFKTLFPQQES
jgi:hypothetical protein